MAEHTAIDYTQPGCASCQQVKRWLTQQGVPFTEHNIPEDEEVLQVLTALGSQGVPTTVIDEQIVIGFDPRRLGEHLGLPAGEEKAG